MPLLDKMALYVNPHKGSTLDSWLDEEGFINTKEQDMKAEKGQTGKAKQSKGMYGSKTDVVKAKKEPTKGKGKAKEAKIEKYAKGKSDVKRFPNKKK